MATYFHEPNKHVKGPPVLEVRGRSMIVRPAMSDELDEMVYVLLQLVPPGFVTSYGAIAKCLGIHPRRVARALARNSNPVVVPCHRVIMGDGSLGGYTLGQNMKRMLLELEGVVFAGNKVRKEYIVDLSSLCL
ncbi:MAG: MGMT family protein [Desulfurococcaceae archaeon]